RQATFSPDAAHLVMLAPEFRIADSLAPLHRHVGEHRENADDQQCPAVAVHVEDAAAGQEAGGDRADDRPRAGIDQVIGMLWRSVRLAHISSPELVSSRRVPATPWKPLDALADAPGTSCRTA